jgi:hypothetical protein
VTSVTSLAFALAWDPGLRGILVVAVAITVLMGSTYAILATNLGARLGFMVAFAGLFGWMAMMGLVWAVYGIGYKGTQPSWKVEEVITSTSVDDLSASKLAKAHDLSKWRKLAPDNPSRGEAQAAATAGIVKPAAGTVETISHVPLYDADTQFLVLDAYDIGGKKHDFLSGILPGPHPAHYAIVQVQGVVATEVPFGETPPTPKADPSKPVRSVVLVRDLGKKRLPSALIGLASAVLFAIACGSLHRRDKALHAARTAVLA